MKNKTKTADKQTDDFFLFLGLSCTRRPFPLLTMASAEASVMITHACERDTALRGIKNSQSILLTVATGASPARSVQWQRKHLEMVMRWGIAVRRS